MEAYPQVENYARTADIISIDLFLRSHVMLHSSNDAEQESKAINKKFSVGGGSTSSETLVAFLIYMYVYIYIHTYIHIDG